MAKLKDPKSKASTKKFKKKDNGLVKTLGLFDHVNQINQIRDPDYFKYLTESDEKTFNHFMILRALSMNIKNLDTISMLYRYFDSIPSPQFYKLLISVIPYDSRRYPWIKSKNKKLNKELIRLITVRFEIPNKEAEDYIHLLSLTKEGKESLVYICQEFGKSEKEIEQLLSNNDDEQ